MGLYVLTLSISSPHAPTNHLKGFVFFPLVCGFALFNFGIDTSKQLLLCIAFLVFIADC